MPLTKQDQIKVLEDAKLRLSSGRNRYLREAVYNASRKLFSQKTQIPMFTFENAKIACKVKKVKMPNEEQPDWFDAENKISKFAFINWMICELKK